MFILLVISIFLLLFAIEFFKNVFAKRPPGPIGLPIVGYTPFLGSDPIKTIQQLADNYGKIVRLKLFGSDYYILNDLESINEAFVKQGDNFSGRPSDEFTMYSFFFGQKNFLSSENETWKAQQKFLLGKLTSLGMGKSVFEVVVNNECESLVAKINKHNGNSFDIYSYLANFASNVVSQILFSQSNEITDPRYSDLRKNALYFFVSIPQMDAYFSGPMFHIKKKLEFRTYKNLLKAKHLYHEHMTSLLNQRMNCDDRDERRDDLLGFYVDALKSDTSNKFDVETIISNFCFLFVDPPETAALLLYHCLNLMILYPDIQRKVQKEIDDIIGKNLVSFEHKCRMNYTQAVFSEIERYVCIVPLSFVRVNHCETTVGGFKIPKRSKFISNLWRLSRDKRYFANPHHFDPENFLDENGMFKKFAAHMPFSVGKRKCLGMKVAEVQNFISFTTLMQKFTWKSKEGEIVERRIQEGLLRVLHPFQVCAIPR